MSGAAGAPLTLFASDNYAGAHPAVLEAVAAANGGLGERLRRRRVDHPTA